MQRLCCIATTSVSASSRCAGVVVYVRTRYATDYCWDSLRQSFHQQPPDGKESGSNTRWAVMIVLVGWQDFLLTVEVTTAMSARYCSHDLNGSDSLPSQHRHNPPNPRITLVTGTVPVPVPATTCSACRGVLSPQLLCHLQGAPKIAAQAV